MQTTIKKIKLGVDKCDKCDSRNVDSMKLVMMIWWWEEKKFHHR